jgi:Domain of unknown function (DUF4062)
MATGPITKSRRVFISSTTLDLAQYREEAQKVINAVSTSFGGRFTLTPVSMTTQAQDGEPTTPIEVSRAWVRDSCDWVVLIVAWHYGWVPPGSTVSVTEAEYLTAREGDKKCFVFLPGERGDTGNIYRAQPTEREDLQQWRGAIKDPAHQAALDNFKARLRDRHSDLFSNLDAFRDKLAEALRQQVTEELFQVIGPTIDQLGLQPPLQDCLDEVKLLARLKRLHDTLHQIRQFGIRAWREELAASWPADADPPAAALIKYLKGAPDIAKRIGRIGNLVEELPASVTRRLRRLGKVVDYAFPEVPEWGKNKFTESTDAFATWVQELFSSCDAEMGEGAIRLADRYGKLALKTRQALDNQRIAPGQMAMVSAELDRSMQIHDRLQHVLQNHRRWQRIHDEFELIDNKVQQQAPTEDDPDGSLANATFVDAADYILEAQGDPVRDLLKAVAVVINPEHAERLARCTDLVSRVDKHLDALIAEPAIEPYTAMRKGFDDLFFQIDLETLDAVESAEARVRAIEAGLRGGDPPAAAAPGTQ